ncbi:hypothetical protein E5676_scaffold190G00020 [Cucumis melo var. makuwa]|uniref:Uncharacterized protein n=1 Tax=Cucumis melo var. makuwa TaxID=1194695 RepID=A0A5A7VFM1_CUCMM|nr:hypothetical protein E6C27_scaffold25G00840 [Cucumis melo var. makuwa]TYK25914.1 hypothetical protein E5676_scaffold190G00020 [Cucumis melo var. makuwa]
MEVKGEVRTAATVHCIIVIHKNKTKLKRLKIKQDDPSTFSDDAFNEKQEDGVGSPVLSLTRKEIVEDEVNDPLQKQQEINLEVDGKTHLPSSPKSA